MTPEKSNCGVTGAGGCCAPARAGASAIAAQRTRDCAKREFMSEVEGMWIEFVTCRVTSLQTGDCRVSPISRIRNGDVTASLRRNEFDGAQTLVEHRDNRSDEQ